MKNQIIGIGLLCLAIIGAGSFTRIPQSSWVFCALIVFIILGVAVWANAESEEEEDVDEQATQTTFQVVQKK